MSDPGFTDKQIEVWEQVCELLHEHFDACFIAVQAEADDDDRSEVKTYDYHGGMSTCIGLAEIGLLTMKQESVNHLARKEPDDDEPGEEE